jgi:uncharacterized protein YgiB involved in biofilm formation
VAKAKPRKARRRAVELTGVAVAVAAIALGIAFFPRAPDHAIVLVTVDDCRRSFGDVACHAIVDRAQAIHVATAPSFEQRQTCELIYGAGHCSMLKRGLIELNRFAPTMTAILLTQKRDAIVPLYDGPEAKPGDAAESDGHAVYFRGTLVGRLMEQKIGGADASFVADAKGDPLTADAVRGVHGP